MSTHAGVDINARQASFNVDSSSGGSSSGGGASGSVVQPYDLLVGADGVGSAVRQALQAFYPDMSVVRHTWAHRREALCCACGCLQLVQQQHGRHHCPCRLPVWARCRW